jgi:hypothetical protein
VEALVSFALVLVSFKDFGLLFLPTLVCNNWLCTSMDVEVGFCNPLLKKLGMSLRLGERDLVGVGRGYALGS